MKILLLASVLTLFSCRKQEPVVFAPFQADPIPPKENAVYKREPDTIKRINVFLNDSIKIAPPAEDFLAFEYWFKDMSTKKILPPDKAYNDFGSIEKYKAIGITFGSEAGQDTFYLLYAYFLGNVNGKGQYIRERQELTAAYHGINWLKSYYQSGGTYFGHMYRRIYGYSEYSIYALDKELNSKTDVAGGRNRFISMLKKIYSEKVGKDVELSPKEKAEKLKELLKIIDNIESNITNAYTLKEVKQFYTDHYNY